MKLVWSIKRNLNTPPQLYYTITDYAISFHRIESDHEGSDSYRSDTVSVTYYV